MIYLDANATTFMPDKVVAEMVRWVNKGNPSAGYSSAVKARACMEEFKQKIGALCDFSPCCAEDRDVNDNDTYNRAARVDPAKYKVIFTSGASESNCMAINGIINSYTEITGGMPHVVASAIEHKSILDMLEDYAQRRKILLTLIPPTPSGHILAASVAAALRPNTALVCVMHANNETGAINDIASIGAIAHSANIPFHTDAVQIFGKYPLRANAMHVDSFTVSFHKLYGPAGCGLLVIKQALLIGYKFSPMIYGTQNDGMRGGTENLPAIMASAAAFNYNFARRNIKNKHLEELKTFALVEISKHLPVRHYSEYIAGVANGNASNSTTSANTNAIGKNTEIILLCGVGKAFLPNTILMAISVKDIRVCNAKIKHALEARGIIVSVGSACNTASSKASHVLRALGADAVINAGALRISMCDDTTIDDVIAFVTALTEIIKNKKLIAK